MELDIWIITADCENMQKRPCRTQFSSLWEKFAAWDAIICNVLRKWGWNWMQTQWLGNNFDSIMEPTLKTSCPVTCQINKLGDSLSLPTCTQYWNNQFISLTPPIHKKVCSVGVRNIHLSLTLRMEATSVLFIRDAPNLSKVLWQTSCFSLCIFFPLPINLPLLNGHSYTDFLVC